MVRFHGLRKILKYLRLLVTDRRFKPFKFAVSPALLLWFDLNQAEIEGIQTVVGHGVRLSALMRKGYYGCSSNPSGSICGRLALGFPPIYLSIS
jgi:hypothetical protein